MTEENKQKIEDAIRKAHKEKRSNFKSRREFGRFSGVGHEVITPNTIKYLETNNIYVKTHNKTNSSEVKRLLEIGIDKAHKENKKHFNTKKEFASYCYLAGSTISSEYMDLAKEKGISIIVRPNTKIRASKTLEKIDRGIKRAKEENRLVFNSRNEFAEYCGVFSSRSSRLLLEKAKENGLQINVQKNAKEASLETIKKLDTSIEKAKKENRLLFKSINEFSKFSNIEYSIIKERHLEYLKNYGITVIKKKDTSLIGKEYIKKLEEKLIEAKNKGVDFFSSKQEFLEYFGVNNFNKKYSNLAEKYGIKVKKNPNSKENRETSRIKILNAIEKAHKENRDNFSNLTEFAKFANVGYGTLTVEIIEFIEDCGITIGKISSKNYNYVLSKLVKMNVKLERRTKAIIEFADNFLNIKVNNIADFDNEVYINLNEKEKVKIVEKALLELLDYLDNFWILEIKLHILTQGYYLCEDTIIQILKQKDIETKDSIEGRIRFTQNFLNLNLIAIEYIDKIPSFNSSSDGMIYIDNEIKNDFTRQWEEYILFLINNNLDTTESVFPRNWDGTLKHLIKEQEAYKKAFLLDLDIQLNYEIIAAIAFVGGKRTKNEYGNKYTGLAQVYHSLRFITSGFFLWLVMKESAISHPKFIAVLGNSYMHSLVKTITKNHNLFKIKKESESSMYLSDVAKKSLISKNANAQIYKLASSISPSSSLTEITTDEVQGYNESSMFYTSTVKNVDSHLALLQNLCLSVGNKEVHLIQNKFDMEEKLNDLLIRLKISNTTRTRFSKLSKRAISLSLEMDVGNFTKENNMKAYLLLLEFLNIFKDEISFNKMRRILNIEYKDEEKIHFSKWLEDNNNEKKFNTNQAFIVRLFQVSPIQKYKNVFACAVKLNKKKKARSFVRGGFSQAVYHTIQKVAFKTPVKCKSYPIIRTNFDGENIDMNWWDNRCDNAEKNTSPVMATCIWLITKLPRRSIHIRNLDVNTFLKYDSFGNLEGFFINSDKNKNISQNDRNFIPKFLLSFIFSEEEFKYLRSYVNYVKEVYREMPKQAYSGENHDDLIQPLFPSNDNKSIINKKHIDSMYTKTLIVTQINIREFAKNSYYDHYYNKDIRDDKKNDLKEIVLVDTRENKDKMRTIPQSIEELRSCTYSDSVWGDYFNAVDGLHNLRHAGSSSLFADGLSFDAITFITGHVDDKVLKSVYIHYREEDHKRVMQKLSPSIAGQLANISLENPLSPSRFFVKQLDKEQISSENQEYLLEELKQNGYISLKRTIISSDKNLYGIFGEVTVENGLELAACHNPLSLWQEQNHGLCSMDRQCPNGTHGECSLCPHLIFNAGHLEGIVHKIRELSLQLSFLGSISYRATLEGTNTERKSIEEKFNITLSSLFGFYEMLNMIEEQIRTALRDTNNKSLVVNDSHEKLLSFYGVCQTEASIEFINSAKNLNINNEFIQHNISQLSFKALKKASLDGNQKTVDEISKQGINILLSKWNNASKRTKEKLLIDYFSEDKNRINAIKEKEKSLSV